MSYIILACVAGAIGLAVVLMAVGYALSTIRDHERRLDALETRAAPSKHDALHRERHDIGEASLFDLARMRDELKVAQDWLEYAMARAEHVSAGGRPDDPPNKWIRNRRD